MFKKSKNSAFIEYSEYKEKYLVSINTKKSIDCEHLIDNKKLVDKETILNSNTTFSLSS